ncbi:MAG: UDP-N-acetylglucosamine--N-acetylmuramyl-(pentapeptide) pyrophosphoryl-undecaprenol N-acetylglucosamine transferase [Candidatus Woesebacteria bacterium]
MTLYVTGGHLTPALAVIDEIVKRDLKIKLRFVGREFSQAQTQQPSRERAEMEKRKIPFVAITAAKFHRTHLSKNILEVLKFPISIAQIIREFRKHKPDFILSFGGYLAVPVCLVGKFYGAKVITHEQTKVAGLANQILGLFVDTVAVAHEESVQYFPPGKTVLTGNPIREVLFREYKTAPSWCSDAYKSKPILYVTGGSQGSHIINQTIVSLLPKLVRDFYVVHQCGVSLDQETLKDLIREREKLPQELQDNYSVREWIEEKEVSYFLRNSKFVICRAGANTVQELILAGTPAIFIPLAYAYNDEQYKNALPLVEHDASILLAQKDLYPESLYAEISTMLRRYDTIKAHMEEESTKLIKNGTNRLIKLLLV